MTQFTDSPYERMMTQNHLSGREARLPPAPPSDSPCCGCPYGRDAPCLGICYRKLMKRGDTHAVNNR